MKRKPQDKDPFDIKADKNRYDGHRHNEVVDGEECGESSPYWNWVEQNGGYDPISLDSLTDLELPWASPAQNEVVHEQWEAFKAIYPFLTGKQKEVVKILLSGQTDQTAIGAMLGISRQAVKKVLNSIQKKIVAEMGCDEGIIRGDIEGDQEQ